MSYEGMARSYVKELVCEAFELDEVVVDSDGDLPFPCGTAMFYASLIRGGRVLRVWSRALAGAKIDKALLREVNETNVDLMFARVYVSGHCVIVEGCLPMETLRVQDVGVLCTEVGMTADRLGLMLATVHGGHISFPQGRDAAFEAEAE